MPRILVIPSIDIKDGKTVRVVQGIPELALKCYGDDPVETAKLWRAENAKCIHVFNFSGIISGPGNSTPLIKSICDSVIIPVQLAGGIRSRAEASDAFNAGVYRVVIGTLAEENPDEFGAMIKEFGPEKIVAAVDVVGDQVVTRMRKHFTGIDPLSYALRLRDLGAERLLVTDVMTNGMLLGPNLKLSMDIAEATGLKVTHSGGISGFKDLREADQAFSSGVDSVIIGRALYENIFPCQRIWRKAEAGIFWK